MVGHHQNLKNLYNNQKYKLKKKLMNFTNKSHEWNLKYDFPISQNFVTSAIRQCYEHLQNYSHLLEDKVIMDIGSNLGYFSRCVAENVNYKQINMFEPCNLYHTESIKLLSGFQNIFHNNAGVGSTNSKLTLYKDRTESNPGWNTLLKKDPMQLEGFYNNLIPEEVDIIKLDDFYKDIESIDFMKIDVEGWERHVISGAMELLKKHKPHLLIEVAWGTSHPEWDLCKKVYDDLFSIGYKTVNFTNYTQDILFEPIR
jgi:FkbM family methyltransferase